MSCPHCSPSDVIDGERLFIWPPQGHTEKKITGVIAEESLAFRVQADVGAVVVEVDDDQRLATRFVDSLSIQERRNTKILVTRGEDLSTAHIPNVLSLDEYIGGINGRWLTEILHQDRLTHFFHPILGTDGSAFGYEMLIRGLDHEGGIINAGALFESAATPNLIASLDRSARIGAVRRASELPDGQRMFINFVPSSIYDPAYCLRSTVNAITRAGQPADRFVFEIVESDRIDDYGHLKEIVDFYRDNGFAVALDDFGTGYNNLYSLLSLKPDYIKVDKAITQRIVDDRASRSLFEDLLRHARTEGIAVIAEGVETAEQLDACTDMGVDLVQGFYFGKPAPKPNRRAA